jgi:ribonucleoside-diphosphate reductase beta chain
MNVTPDKLFFGESGHGISRYDIIRYSTLDKIDEKMKSFYWNPKEIDLSQERRSFSSMTDIEQFVFTSNLKRQILLDSIQGRSPTLAFLPYCSDPILENCLTTWAFFETIHSQSYTHIIRSIYPDPKIVIDDMPNIKQITDCATDITKVYDELIKNPNKENLYLGLISANALEALRFYVSFACTFSFLERGLVEGSAKIVKLIARDENCLHPDTEVLTTSGWVKILDIKLSDNIAQVDLDTFNISFSNPDNIINKAYSGNMVRIIQSTTGKILQHITEDHDIILSRSNSNNRFSSIKKCPVNKSKFNVFNYLPVSGVNYGNLKLTYMERLAIAIQADGSFSDRYTGEICGTIPVRIFLSKLRKIKNLDYILNNLPEISWIKNETQVLEPKLAGYTYTINLPKNTFIDKNFSWVNIENLETGWCREFMEELVKWDGHIPKDADYLYYSNTNSIAIDNIQAILAFTGFKHRRGIQIDKRSVNFNDIHRIYWWDIPNIIGRIPTQNLKKEYYEYSGLVGCVTMPKGTIITRYNNNVCITGNCHLALVQNILKMLPQDDPEFMQIINDNKDKAKSLFVSAAEQEKEWAEYLFKDGSMLGLNSNILSNYVDHLLNKRMRSIGLTNDSKIDNPIPWIDKHLSSKNSAPAPQEVEISSYLVGSIKNNISELDLGGLW